MSKHRFDSRPKREGNIRTPGTNANNVPEHFFRIAQWALLKGGTFTARELREHFGISDTSSFRYAKAWRAVFGEQGPVIRKRREREVVPPAPVKLTLDDLLKR